MFYEKQMLIYISIESLVLIKSNRIGTFIEIEKYNNHSKKLTETQKSISECMSNGDA